MYVTLRYNKEKLQNRGNGIANWNEQANDEDTNIKFVKLQYSPAKKRGYNLDDYTDSLKPTETIDENEANLQKTSISTALNGLLNYNEETMNLQDMDLNWFKNYIIVNDKLCFLKELYKSIELIKKRKRNGDLSMHNQGTNPVNRSDNSNLQQNPISLLEDSEIDDNNDTNNDEEEENSTISNLNDKNAFTLSLNDKLHSDDRYESSSNNENDTGKVTPQSKDLLDSTANTISGNRRQRRKVQFNV